MGNFKVKVNNEAESREAQELFFELGASWCDGKHINENMPDDGAIILHNFGSQLFWAHVYESKNYDDAKELTLPELRTMVNPSINDQYAEIEQVRQTLNERQSQYGSFKDVADTTAVFMDQFALGYMSNVQREALHMICSKLARIANGDPNHVDSWHDISGYATLVVDDLES